MKTGKKLFAPSGAMAIVPTALSVFYEAIEQPSTVDRTGIAVVPVRGPLMHHEDWWGDSYDALSTRIDAALEVRPKAIVLAIDSPGGLVSGLFDTALAIKAKCNAASVPLHAFVDGLCASAAYALACVCESITIPSTGIVGSIGVIESLVDMSASNALHGVAVELIASGSRKTDGNPNVAISPESRAATQGRVDFLAGIFFDHVSAHRAMPAESVRALEAALFTGASGVAAGLADKVGTLNELVASLATSGAPSATTKETTMDEKEEAARASLQAIIDDEKADEKAKARARTALAAMDEPAEEEKPKEEEASASASTVEARLAQLELERENERKDALFASRPDLPAKTVEELRKHTFASAQALANTIPRTSIKPTAGLPQPTRGEGQGEAQSHLPPSEARALDVAMGLAKSEANVRVVGTLQTLDTMTRSQARAELARRQAQANR